MLGAEVGVALVLLSASGEIDRSRGGTGSNTKTGRAVETNECEVKTDTSTGSVLNGGWDRACQPLSDTQERETDKDETFDEDGGYGESIGDATGTMVSDDLVGEVGVETHAGGETDGEVGKETHAEGGEAGDCGGTSNKITTDN